MRSFSSIPDFVAHMHGLIRALPGAQRRGLERGAALLLIEMRSYPGRYQSGWPALKPATVARKATGDSPLLETGAMRDSYEKTPATPVSVSIGSNDMRAVWQELGTSRGIPPRPVVQLAARAKGRAAAHLVGRAIFNHLCGNSNAP